MGRPVIAVVKGTLDWETRGGNGEKRTKEKYLWSKSIIPRHLEDSPSAFLLLRNFNFHAHAI